MLWRLHVMGLSCSMGVQWLEVDGPPGCPILLSTNNHPVAPCNWFPNRHRFNDTKTDVTIEVSLDLILPVDWYRIGEWKAVGSASSSIISLTGGPDISGNGWCSQVLKVLLLWGSRMYFSNFSRFSFMAGKGNLVGSGGGGDANRT